MSDVVKRINNFFRYCSKSDESLVYDKLLLTDRQDTIYKMYYRQDKDINFIADTINACPSLVDKELKIIRTKIIRVLDL